MPTSTVRFRDEPDHEDNNERRPADLTEPNSGFFEASLDTPARGERKVFVFGENDWDEVRSAGIVPHFVSDLAASQSGRDEFIFGAKLLGLSSARKPLVPQQLFVSDMLDAGRKLNGVLIPRRSAKSTSLIAKALGRAAKREDYRGAILTMTTGKAGRSRFTKDVAPLFDRAFPNARLSPFKVMKSAGQEGIYCRETGGSLSWLSSIEDLRGEAFDFVILDEAGEPEPEKVEDALAAGLPTMDTRPGSQLVVAGTAGDYRDGNLLWDMLELGRAGEAGILEYSAPESTSIEDLESWPKTARLVLDSHPGIDTLPTTLEDVRGNWVAMKPEKFLKEYLSIFGIGGGQAGLIKSDVWAKLADPGALPEPPKRFALAIAAHRDQTAAAIVAAWRDEKRRAHLLVLAHDRGVQWLPGRAYELAMKFKTPIVHDSMGVVLVETEQIARRSPHVKLEPQTTRNIQTAAALVMKDIETGMFVHHNQPSLTEAARVVVKRRILSGWGFGSDEDITTLEAGAMALRSYDQDVPRIPMKLDF